jgi:protocatechuate 3,4-dioxygenase beta subunit
MKTDAQGRYQFKTIRPASYPNRQAPQHIHPIIKEPGTSLYWIDEYLFEDDPLLTSSERSRQEKRGGSGIIRLKKNEKGVWMGQRNIILGMNIPNY